MDEENTSSDLRQLGALLAVELSAKNAYDRCIEGVDDEARASQLRVLRVSHQHRAELLARRIVALGGSSLVTSLPGRGIATAHEDVSAFFSSDATLSNLQNGEDEGLLLYRDGLRRLSIVERRFVEDVLLPEQQRSSEMLRTIERSSA